MTFTEELDPRNRNIGASSPSERFTAYNRLKERIIEAAIIPSPFARGTGVSNAPHDTDMYVADFRSTLPDDHPARHTGDPIRTYASPETALAFAACNRACKRAAQN